MVRAVVSWCPWVLFIFLGGLSFIARGNPTQPPSFWDQSIAIGVGRPSWVYYHVTNLPRNSILYCPPYPDSPEAYPGWPRRRLTHPLSIERNGEIVMRDPQVEEAQEQEQAAKGEWNNRIWTRLEGWVGRAWRRYFPPRETFPVKNYLFRPKLNEEFSSSTIFRYLPPDQFWQICAEEVILVSEEDSQEVREKFVKEGRDKQKLVLLVGTTPYQVTVHTANFWQPWSLFIRPPQEENRMGSSGVSIDRERSFFKTLRESGRGVMGEPNQAGEQTKRRWQILRQVDLKSNSYLDLLVDAEGETEAPWVVGERGSRFEVWVMTWGTVRPQLVECWSVFPASPSRAEKGGEMATGTPCRARFLRTGREEVVVGQDYDLAWTGGGSEGEFGLQEWSESSEGDLVGGTHFQRVLETSHERRHASVGDGSDHYALWWQPSPREDWILLSQLGQSIHPLPRVDLLSGQTLPELPWGQTLDLAGHGFPSHSTAKVLVRQLERETLVKEFVGKSEWEVSVDPRALSLTRGRALLTVEYPSPWSGRSELPSSWKMEKAMEFRFTIK